MSAVGKIIYKIMGDNSDLAKSLDKVGDMAEQAVSAVAKIGTVAMGAAVTGVGVLAKKAIDCYAEYEQLVGGVETLFGTSADVIKQYADEAYRTAGLSANAYMETATSFSASLLQGLEGDTAKAAEIANQAIIDMSDNANKMGTDMSMIQNAYQGFAKQNYTMLDNLKLGYGGTQSEMARLINDSGVLGDSMTVTVETVNSVSFDKIIEAIHVLQTKMGISGISAEEAAAAVASGAMTEEEAFEAMGTTAKEAATTIQGSISSMSAAWENFMTGIADPSQDFDRLTSNLIDSVLTVADNLIPRIMAVLPQMATGLEELAENLLPLIPQTLEQILPDVLAGANSLISALLDTLSSIAETAIPIVSENAEEIINTLLTGMVESLPEIANSAVDLCAALIEAVLDNADNADIITQGAVDIVLALAEGISDNLPELIPAAVNAVLTVAETLLSNVDELLDAAEQIIFALADGLIASLPVLLEKAPVIVFDLIAALVEAIPDIIEFAVELCERIADNLVNHDWAATAQTTLTNLGNALDNAQKNVQIGLDYLFTGGELYGGDVNNVRSTEFVKNYQAGTEELVGVIEEGQKFVQNAYNNGKDILNGTPGNYAAGQKWLKEEEERQKNAEAVLAKYKDTAEEWKKSQAEVAESDADSAPDPGKNGVVRQSEMLEEALTDLEHSYKTHKVTEEAYWAERKRLLELYRDDDSEEWNELYDKVTEHYEKLAQTEAKAAEKAAKEQETALKQSVEDKFRELETEQLRKGYDDSWLLEQERAFIETLDHNSEVYKDYNLKLLKEQKSTDDKAAKEAETAAKKQQDAVEKSYDSIVKSRDKLAESLQSSADIFTSSEETDKRTGAKKKSRGIDINGFEKKLAAKKKLTSKIAELLEANAPESLISELLKQDPEDALAYANELLRSPSKLKDIRSAFTEDEGVSKVLANMVTEKSSEFAELGTEAGDIFGESFTEAFKADWEQAFEDIFSDDNAISQSVSVISSANGSAAAESTYVRRDSSGDNQSGTAFTGKASSAAGSAQVYRIVDLNGKYVATVVNAENKRTKVMGGG